MKTIQWVACTHECFWYNVWQFILKICNNSWIFHILSSIHNAKYVVASFGLTREKAQNLTATYFRLWFYDFLYFNFRKCVQLWKAQKPAFFRLLHFLFSFNNCLYRKRTFILISFRQQRLLMLIFNPCWS